MAGFELKFSGVGSDLSANCTTLMPDLHKVKNVSKLGKFLSIWSHWTAAGLNDGQQRWAIVYMKRFP